MGFVLKGQGHKFLPALPEPFRRSVGATGSDVVGASFQETSLLYHLSSPPGILSVNDKVWGTWAWDTQPEI